MKNFLFPTFTAEFGWVCPFFGWVWVGVTFYGMDVGECECVWVSVTLFWLGVGGCGWVWPFYGCVWVAVDGCGWVWVSAWSITAHLIVIYATLNRYFYKSCHQGKCLLQKFIFVIRNSCLLQWSRTDFY